MRVSKLLAPFTPFLAQTISCNLSGNSAHFMDWSDGQFKTDKLLVKDYGALVIWMKIVRNISELGHSQRKQKQIPVRQPLAKIRVKFSVKKPSDELLQLIKDELNVKEVEWVVDKKLKEPEVALDTKLTPSLEEEGKARELIRNIQMERRRMGLGLTDKVKVKSGWLPKNKELLENLKKKTLAEEVSKGSFKVVKVD